MIRALEPVRFGFNSNRAPVTQPLDSAFAAQSPLGSCSDHDSVLLVDPITISRESFSCWLQAHIGSTTVQACANASQVIDTPPRIVLLHTHSLGLDDPPVQSQITSLQELYGNTPAIAIITDREQGELAIAAIHRKILHGYIPTHLGSSMVAAAIRLLMAGGIFIPPELIAQKAEYSPANLPYPEPSVPEPRQLTPREAEVLRLLRQGRPNKLIAFEMAISESTVKVHIRNIMRKMNVTNRTQVALSIEAQFETKDYQASAPPVSLHSVLRQVEDRSAILPVPAD